MITSGPEKKRALKQEQLSAQLVIVGGGLAGVCCAITAARQGVKVVLVQDRPVLGGNSSSEVRLWVLGATSHMGNNNRWAREGGVIDELLVENMYRNKEGNPLIYDTILLEKVVMESNITLLLNTAVYEVSKKDDATISSITAFCSQNSTLYRLDAPLFCDASGDGVVGFLSGAAFRMGAESGEEFGEQFAPTKAYGELLGHSLYFYSKDVGRPVRYVPPAFALNDITRIPRFRSFNTREYGCKLWWIEYGGRLDTVHDTEAIKWELWKVIYGVWNYIKNSGNFPEAETLTLEWVGTIPGKRESRRFEGDYILRQQDIVEQRQHPDAVAFGGWSIDLHPADGVFSEKPGCNQWHSKGLYQIPYRCLYSRNISNLFLAGRIISASHVAFGSSRVMATCAYTGQAVAMAAQLCLRQNITPKRAGTAPFLAQMQGALQRIGHYIPNICIDDKVDLVHTATLSASSEWALQELSGDTHWEPLQESVAQMIPVGSGAVPTTSFQVQTTEATTLVVQLLRSSRRGAHTPDEKVEEKWLPLQAGKHTLTLSWNFVVSEPEYLYVCLRRNEQAQVLRSAQRATGLLSVFNTVNKAVSNNGYQQPTGDIGVDAFEFWCPKRRPAGHNLAFSLSQPLHCFGADNIRNGIARPVNQPNAWVADPEAKEATLTIQWPAPQTIRRIELSFDTDFDHPMETVLMSHPEDVMPFCVQDYTILDGSGNVLYRKVGNYQSRNEIVLDQPVRTTSLTLQFSRPESGAPVAVFEVRCYAD